jgi:hypothetical protein
MTNLDVLQKEIRILLLLFIIALVLSGLTAFPIETQLTWAHEVIIYLGWHNTLTDWLEQVYIAVKHTNAQYPFIAYGTDWLAFAHIVIGIAFIGPLRDPVRNVWVIEFGIIACLAIFPLAFIAGSIRGIPIFWQLIDCSFGVIGGTLLGIIWKKIKQLEHLLFLQNKPS